MLGLTDYVDRAHIAKAFTGVFSDIEKLIDSQGEGG